VIKLILNTKYYDTTNFLNVYYSLNLAIEQFFTDFLFKGESNRVIFSSTEYAFRRRNEINIQLNTTDTDSLNNLNFPFMNYRGKISDKSDKAWWSHRTFVDGCFIPELGKKIRTVPTLIDYDATIYYHKEIDTVFAMNELVFDAGDETKIFFQIEIDGEIIDMFGILGYNLDHDSEYNENSWLEQNHIHTIKLDFTIDTVMLRLNPQDGEPSNPPFAITEKTIFNFNTLHCTGAIQSTETIELINDYFAAP
jgi:hypothetical protein